MTSLVTYGTQPTRSDRRRAERVPFRRRVELLAQPHRIAAFIRDLSSTGVFVNCRARLSVGTAVTLRFQCTNGMLLETTGVVVRFARVHHALSQFSVAGLAVRFDAELPHPSHL